MTTDFDLISANLNRYVVTPLNAFGVGGFVFDIEGETKVDLSTEISDHFLEDNSTVQDHIAIKPKKMTLKNYVGELSYTVEGEEVTFVQKAVQKLTVLNQALPELTEMAQQVLDARKTDLTISGIKEAISSKTINRTTDYWSYIKNLTNSQSKQQQAYQYFKALMEEKMLVSVQTPFEFMNRMAIESITAIQSEDSRYISDFTIVLKELRFAEILNVPAGELRYRESSASIEDFQTGRTAVQNEDLTNQGNINGLVSDTESIYRSLGVLGINDVDLNELRNSPGFGL